MRSFVFEKIHSSGEITRDNYALEATTDGCFRLKYLNSERERVI